MSTRAFSLALASLSVLACGSPPAAAPSVTAASSARNDVGSPLCQRPSPAAVCLQAAIDAMGGRSRLESVHTLRADVATHTLLVKQSYRQAPFITAYGRDHVAVDLAGKRLRIDGHATWPESDFGTSDSDATLIGSTTGAVYHGKTGDRPRARRISKGFGGGWSLGRSRCSSPLRRHPICGSTSRRRSEQRATTSSPSPGEASRLESP